MSRERMFRGTPLTKIDKRSNYQKGREFGLKYAKQLVEVYGDKALKGSGWFDWVEIPEVNWSAPWSWDEFAQGFRDGFNATRHALGYAAPVLDWFEPGLGTAVGTANTALDWIGVGHPPSDC